jgi:DNA polymerase-1
LFDELRELLDRLHRLFAERADHDALTHGRVHTAVGSRHAMPERTLVASATNLLARGFMVVPTDRKAPAAGDGLVVNALFAVARAILRGLAFKLPAHAVAVIGPANPKWPAILTDQRPLLAELCRTLGLAVVEADDELRTVAAYTRDALAAGDDVVIVGIDKRFAQLVSDRVWWYDANKDARYTPEMVAKRFGVPPEQAGEWLALVGDDDQMPGVAGIGAKGATELLAKYATTEAALADVANTKGRTGNALRAAGPEVVRTELARGLLANDRAVPLAEIPYTPQSPAVMNALFERLGFVELLVADGGVVSVTVCETAAQLHAELAKLGTLVAHHPVALQPLFDATDEIEHLAGIAFASGDTILYAPLAGTGRTIALADLAAWLADPSIAKCVHFREGLCVALARAGLVLANDHDSAAASHLSQPSNWAPHDLAVVAKLALGRALPDPANVLGTGAQQQPWAAISTDRAADFAGQYANACGAVWAKLAPAIAPALLAEYHELSETCVRMELHGIGVACDELDGAEADFAVIEAELEKEIFTLAGHELNINSSKQLGTLLFEELKLPIVSHTKTGWSTSIEALERIEYAHPIVALVLRWRVLRRLRDSWIIALRTCIAPDGRVHSRTHPARSFSGRLVNTNPDLSRVPGRTPEMARIRRAFVAQPGHVLLSVDYNQLGLHVLAHLTKDPALVEPLRARADMHVLTASAVLAKPIDQLTYDDRQLGKVVNFATFAGQGASALALQLNVDAAEAKRLIARFDERYSKVRAFQDEQLRLAKARGYIETIAGRHWPIGGLESLDSHDRSYAERLARRATHEGSVADVSRRGLLHADRELRAAGLHCQPLAQILDEVLFEVPEAELPRAAALAGDAMRRAFDLEVPLVVGLEAGANWADLKPLP